MQTVNKQQRSNNWVWAADYDWGQPARVQQWAEKGVGARWQSDKLSREVKVIIFGSQQFQYIAAKETSGPNTKISDEWTSLLCEHAQHVGMETRKHRSCISISQWRATISRMQINSFWSLDTSYIVFPCYLSPWKIAVTDSKSPRKLLNKINHSSSNTGFCWNVPSLYHGLRFLLGMSNGNG